ncbi:hypothetical protein CDAR_540491 [Caerostris darwini]|uniref:Uncharacterized protein n=1 Tax=Caerostris darwini TaxID=1538125 RepID=A0AAV4PQL5_9ARAC|nr:hypothetical protein CDAR_540491 [Caerostris darwini]
MNGNSLEVRESTAPDPYSVSNKMPGVLSFKGDNIRRAKLGESLVCKASGESVCDFYFMFSEWRRESTAPDPYSVFNKKPGGKCVLSFKGDSIMGAKLGESLDYKVSGESAGGFCFMFSEWRFDGDKLGQVSGRVLYKRIWVPEEFILRIRVGSEFLMNHSY